jgi:hypothetical protein
MAEFFNRLLRFPNPNPREISSPKSQSYSVIRFLLRLWKLEFFWRPGNQSILNVFATDPGRGLSLLVRRFHTMSTDKSQQRDELLNRIRDALRRAELYCARTRRWDTRLLIISIICGAVATVLAGGTVIGGKSALDAVGGWRILCAIVAVFTASGTVAGALHKSFQITTRLSSAEKCVARLRTLDAAITASDLPTHNALETFQRISEEHAACLA